MNSKAKKESISTYISVTVFLVIFTIYGKNDIIDPLPYQPIALPFADTVDQLVRDSATIDIGRIRINQAGYRPKDDKFFYYVGDDVSQFNVIDAKTGNTIVKGTLRNTNRKTSSSIQIRASHNAQIVPNGDTRYELTGKTISGSVFEGKIPDLPEGEYKIKINSHESGPFVIHSKVYNWMRDALIKFFGVNRCGNGDSWFHKDCHLKDGPGGDGSLSGGWHDCGDHIKESQTMSYTMAVLALAASALKDRDTDKYAKNHSKTHFTDGIPDILCELRHGVEFVTNSYNQAKGNVGNMYTSVGDFGYDHMWWGIPEAQDNMSVKQGGPVRELRNEVWSSVMGRFATGMAIFSKLYFNYDSTYAKKALEIAKQLYQYGKENQSIGSSSAYNGENSFHDDMGLAAVALLWATKDEIYKNDLLYDKTIGTKGNPEFPVGTFDGGWFAFRNASPQHGMANTDWASTHTLALWSLYKLILRSKSTAKLCGIEDNERLTLIEDVIYAIIVNVADAGKGDEAIVLPAHQLVWKNHTLKYDGLWKTMHTQQEWVWNRYQAGNITELFCYYDIAKELEGLKLPNTEIQTDWKADEVKGVFVQQLDYMLGMNPWDVSMIYGIGNKNFNHPHHRAANPEGKNFPGLFYRYRPPVGGLHGGYSPKEEGNDYKEHFSDYFHSEFGIDATANLLLPVVGLGEALGHKSSRVYVQVMYVDHEKAIIDVRQTIFGTSTIRYGKKPSTDDDNLTSDSSGIFHRFELTGLKPQTTYTFDVVVTDVFKNDTVVMDIDDGKQVPFRFNTNAKGPDDAVIENVKVCKVTHDSVEIYWFTPNGKYDSRVVYGEEKPPAKIHDGDITGLPVSSHYVKIGGLKERTTYYFFVQSGSVVDDNNGKYYSFTTTIEHVNFDVRAVQYDIDSINALGINFVNQDVKSYDSLELRLYLHGTEKEIANFGARVDIGIKYNSAGFQDIHFKKLIDGPLQKQKPVKMDDTFNSIDSTWYWYLPIPLAGATMESGARFRLDLLFVKRNLPYNDDLLNQPATYKPGKKDWTWMPHSQPKDPVNFGGIPYGSKNDVDNEYWNTEINQYITVYRKDHFIWGYSPSPREQANKINYYEMKTQITSPLTNPSEISYTMADDKSTIQIKGWADISEDGVMEEIWINGKMLENIDKYVTYNKDGDFWNFNFPVTLTGAVNMFNINFFAGPPNTSDSCQGCASTSHSFYIKYSGIEKIKDPEDPEDPVDPKDPEKQEDLAKMFIKNQNNKVLTDIVSIDTTQFTIIIIDQKANSDSLRTDIVKAFVHNPVNGDSITITLIETGNSTDTFNHATPIAVVNKSEFKTNDSKISMSSSDSIIVFYQSPGDPMDIEKSVLYATEIFIPLPKIISSWYSDKNADGVIDETTLCFDKPIKNINITNLQIEWSDKWHTVSASQTAQINDSVISVKLKNIFSDNTIQTSGSMNCKLKYKGRDLPAVAVTDRAAPVIVSAKYLINSDKDNKSSLTDTLEITFSEKINNISSDKPFLLSQNKSENKQYSLVLKKSDLSMTRYKLRINDIMGVLFPASGDLIWINVNEGLCDLNSNKQLNKENRRVQLELKIDCDYEIIVNACPNPYIIGKSVIPGGIISHITNPGDISRFENGIAIEIKLNPLSLLKLKKISLKPSMQIFDAVGNRIAFFRDSESISKDIVLYSDPNTGVLYLFWNVRNRYSRIVGSGAYPALVRVVDNTGRIFNKKVMIGAQLPGIKP
jgi:hypothetical protein